MRSVKLLAAVATALALNTVHAADDIVIGQISPLTGVQADTGQAARDGALLYFEKINRAGGIGGRKIVLDARDDEYAPEKTVSQARALIKERQPVLLLSTVGVANVNALLKEKVLETSGVAMLGPTSGSSPMYSAAGVYPVRAGYSAEVQKILKNFATTGVTRLALVYQDDGFGKEALPLVDEFLKKNPSIKLVASVGYDRTKPDLTAQAAEVAKAEPHAVVVMAVTKPAASFIKNFKKAQPSTAVAVVSAVDPEGLVKEIGADAKGTIVGLFLPHPASSRDELVREMHDTSKALGKKPSQSPRFQLGYVTAKVAVSVLQSIKGPITAESVQAALKQAKTFRLSDKLEVRYGAGSNTGINFIDTGLIGTENQFIY